jgi:hypothetical protein
MACRGQTERKPSLRVPDKLTGLVIENVANIEEYAPAHLRIVKTSIRLGQKDIHNYPPRRHGRTGYLSTIIESLKIATMKTKATRRSKEEVVPRRRTRSRCLYIDLDSPALRLSVFERGRGGCLYRQGSTSFDSSQRIRFLLHYADLITFSSNSSSSGDAQTH